MRSGTCYAWIAAVLCLSYCHQRFGGYAIPLVAAFSCRKLPSTTPRRAAASRRLPTANPSLSSSNNPNYFDDDIARLKAKAQIELAKARAKLEAPEEVSASVQAENDDLETMVPPAPFFASMVAEPLTNGKRRSSVIKSVNSETGLITTDGEKMAALSEKEQWESRPLSEVFENELRESNGDVYSLANKQLAERDVAASMWNLRKQLQTEDFQMIFDKRNRFIGETE